MSSKKKGKTETGLPISSVDYPQHIVQMVLILKNNAEIRRFTALSIINYLTHNGDIDTPCKYVRFKWNKFVVKASGIQHEYAYTESWFIDAIIAAFTSFEYSAKHTIEMFLREEAHSSIDNVANAEHINELITAAKEHVINTLNYNNSGDSVAEEK